MKVSRTVRSGGKGGKWCEVESGVRMPLRPYLSLLLLLRDDEIPVDELRRMVWSVNRGVVDEMDRLSDEVYHYQRGSGKLEIAA